MPFARYFCIFINVGLGEAAKRGVGTGENQIPDMASFASGDGWMKLPNGKILQYGRGAVTPTLSTQTMRIFSEEADSMALYRGQINCRIYRGEFIILDDGRHGIDYRSLYFGGMGGGSFWIDRQDPRFEPTINFYFDETSSLTKDTNDVFDGIKTYKQSVAGLNEYVSSLRNFFRVILHLTKS